MAQRGPGIRTSRSRALEIGTDPKGFTGGVAYNPQAGVPLATPGSGSEYKEQAPNLQNVSPKFNPDPFKLGG